jgi:hypothetical protein
MKPLDKKQLSAICAALNKLFWKIPKIQEYDTNQDYANFIIAELADGNIDGIYWSNKHEQFRVKP